MSPSSTFNSGAPGNEYQVADLTVISYEKLLRKDATEAALLHSACAQRGFFYLDLGGSEFEHYRETVDALFGIGKEYFAKPLEEKLKDTRKEIDVYNICGFKPMGDLGLDAGNREGKKNGCETIRVPVDIFFNPKSDPRLSCPEGIKSHSKSVTQFITDSHIMANKVLENLSDSLGLHGEERFENHHQLNAPSTSTAVLQHYPLNDLPPNTSVGYFAHTDTGSLTILFNSDWGLQVYSPQSKGWKYVAPRKDCAIVNVGDSLKFMSGFKLKSSLHRVVPSHGRWTAGSRYASIFFLRANNDAEFIDSEGVAWTAERWLKRKFQNYRIPHKEQEKNAITTGRKGFSGLWEATRDLATVS